MQKLGKIEDANSLKSRRQIMEALGEVRNPERAKLDVYTQVFAEQIPHNSFMISPMKMTCILRSSEMQRQKSSH